jgi:RimJ/RimL family protein N-acetyltransferase
MPTDDHSITVDDRVIRTPRLVLRPWVPDDAPSALDVFGTDEVTRWLAPAMDRVGDLATMRRIIDGWIADDQQPGAVGTSHWAIAERSNDALIGGASIVLMPPYEQDLLVGYQLLPTTWGRGYGAEAGHALAHYAFTHGVNELFAVVRPNNHRAAAVATRIGMEWVGETDKYYGLRLNVYRLLLADLDNSVLKPGPVAD